MSDGNLVTWRSMTNEQARTVALGIGWLLVCIALGTAFFFVACDWVLQ